MKDELKKIKKYLPKGYTQTLANEFNVTPMTVSNALNGKFKRYDIITSAIKMARESKLVTEELNNF
jgi:hypothetical protein